MPEKRSKPESELHFHARARKDILQAVTWYASRRSGLGDQFLLEVQRCLGGLVQNPERYPKIHRSFRQAPLRRFPYVVIYRPLDPGILVMRVFHTKQDPTKKFGS